MQPQSEGSEGGSPQRLYHVTVVAGNSRRDGSSRSSTQALPAPPHSPAHAHAAHATHAAHAKGTFLGRSKAWCGVLVFVFSVHDERLSPFGVCVCASLGVAVVFLRSSSGAVHCIWKTSDAVLCKPLCHLFHPCRCVKK